MNLVWIGPLTLSLSLPGEAFTSALLLNACAIITVHTHLSGDLIPSSDDRALIIQLQEAGDLLTIKLLCHLILGDDPLYSFTDQDRPL